MSKQISIVIPLFNEEESLPHLLTWIQKVLDGKFSYEVIFVDDGSKDKSWEVVAKMASNNASVLGIKFQRNFLSNCGYSW